MGATLAEKNQTPCQKNDEEQTVNHLKKIVILGILVNILPVASQTSLTFVNYQCILILFTTNVTDSERLK